MQRIALGEMYGGANRVVDACLQEIVDGLRQPGTVCHVLAIVRCWFADMARLRRALRRIKRIPTLLVWGDRDQTVSPNSALRLKRKLRGAELIVVPGCGHTVFEETPEQSNRIMLEWLARHPSPTPRLRDQSRSASIVRKARNTAAMRRLSTGD
jgi:pimeloyl-ACP methyl ester carboxylesterase